MPITIQSFQIVPSQAAPGATVQLTTTMRAQAGITGRLTYSIDAANAQFGNGRSFTSEPFTFTSATHTRVDDATIARVGNGAPAVSVSVKVTARDQAGGPESQDADMVTLT